MTVTEHRPEPAPDGSAHPVAPPAAPDGPTRAAGWLGVLAVAVVVGWLGVIGAQALVEAGDLSRSLATAQGRTVGPALIAMVVLIVMAERRWPAVSRPVLARAHLVDAGYLILFGIAVVPALTVVETGFAVEVGRHAAFLLVGRLALLPQLVVVAVTLVAIDGMNWLAHLANHRSASLWRLHALHHSQEDMSVLTTFRTHPLVHGTYLGALLPALVLGASGTVPAVALIVYGCLVTLPHANLPWSFGPLGRIVVSPAYHRLHHARMPVDRRGTVNFGFVLVGWDQLFGYAEFPGGRPPVATGIVGRPVPVETASTTGAFGLVASQLAQPFRRRDPMEGRP